MIALLLACTTSTPEPADTVDTGSSLPGTERPTTEPVWDLPQLEQEFSTLLAQGFPTSRQAMGLYLEVLSHGDEICPGNKEYIEANNLRGCWADSGYFYSGVSTYERQSFVDEGGNTISFEGNTGDYLFRDPEGREMEGGGHQTMAVVVDRSGRVDNVLSEHSGSFLWQAHDGVYQEQVSGSIQVVAAPQGMFRMLYMVGAIQYLGHSLYFNTTLSESCEWRGQSGYLEIRDPSGAWYTLYPDDCSSDCMSVSYGGEPQGEICLDLSPIAAAYAPELEMLQ